MKPEDAEEYTQALGQIVAGGWRQIALGKRLGVPKALGLTTREWVEQRLGGYVRESIDERKEAFAELAAEGESDNAISQITGVDRKTIRKWRNEGEEIPNRTTEDSSFAQVDEPTSEPTWGNPHPESGPLDAVGALAIGEMREKEARKAAARVREPEPVAEPIPPLPGKYRCIVIDPPWPMQKIERDERPNQGVALDYPVMPIECQSPEIVARKIDQDTSGFEEHEPIYSPCFKAWWSDDNGYDDGWQPCRSIECVVGHTIRTSALDDCHIYLWVTHKYLPAGLDLLKTWGFNYQCVMTWQKSVGITPFSWMYDTEHVLFGRRGNLKLQQLGLRLSFEAPVRGHSVKPDVFYDRVIQASPGPRVEMFARCHRDGFTPWGNEVADVV